MSKFEAVFGTAASATGLKGGGGGSSGGIDKKQIRREALQTEIDRQTKARKKKSLLSAEAARKRTLEAAALRLGRRRSILTSPRGVEDDVLGVVQTKAGGTRQAQLFGA